MRRPDQFMRIARLREKSFSCEWISLAAERTGQCLLGLQRFGEHLEHRGFGLVKCLTARKFGKVADSLSCLRYDGRFERIDLARTCVSQVRLRREWFQVRRAVL